MRLNELEKGVIRQFLASKRINIEDEDAFFSDIKVESRDMTGVGFFTELVPSGKLKISQREKSTISCNFGALLNGSIHTGYLIFIEQGYLDTIEGFTYADDWPEKISRIDFYTYPDSYKV